jgi:hypothetical protein
MIHVCMTPVHNACCLCDTHGHTWTHMDNDSDRLSDQFKTPAQTAAFWLASGLW